MERQRSNIHPRGRCYFEAAADAVYSVSINSSVYRNDAAIPRLTAMDRIYLAIIASALLLLLGATGLYVTRTADLMPHARTVGFSGSR